MMSQFLGSPRNESVDIDQREPAPKRRWLPILMYHRVVPEVIGADPYHLKVPVAHFAAQMKFLRDHGYRSRTLAELVQMAARGERPHGKSVIISFDDGYKDIYDYAFPILQQNQLTATLFLVSSCIGGLNTWDRGKGDETRLMGRGELIEMAKNGMELASHSLTHRSLTELNPEEARREIMDSKAALEDQLDLEVVSFSFPFGHSDPALREVAAQAGYQAACGIEQREHTLFNLSRVDVASCGGNWPLWRWKMSGLHHRLRQRGSLRSLKAFLAGTGK